MDLFGLDDLTIGEPSPPKSSAPIKSSKTKQTTKSTKSTASEWDQFE